MPTEQILIEWLEDYCLSVQSVLYSVVSGVRSPSKIRKRRRVGPGAWAESLDVPGSKRIIPGIMKYAETGRIVSELNDVQIFSLQLVGQPQPTPNGLATKYKLDDGQTREIVLPWLNLELGSIADSRWFDLKFGGQAFVDPKCLLPRLTMSGEYVIAVWDVPIKLRWNRFFFRWMELEIKEFRFTKETGRVITSPDWGVIPEFVWV